MNIDDQFKLEGVRDVLAQIEDKALFNQAPWWFRAAFDAVERLWFRAIPTRCGTKLYLLRFWLSKPSIDLQTGDWESGDSVMLHYFARGDDDGAMHSHPWSFTTDILSGGYFEELPHPEIPLCTMSGPRMGLNRVFRQEGDRVQHAAMDLHSACDPLPETWTLIKTGRRACNWGFHPHGEIFSDHRKYLKLDPLPLPPSQAKTAKVAGII